MANFSPPPGTADIFPAEALRWQRLESVARAVFSRYGYGELRTPMFEYTEVFQRGLGDDTEVVQKEMYTFLDRGGRSLTLRPEGTAGVMRSLLNTDVLNGVEQRVYYQGSMFRGERPAAGRRREFHQIGVENVGRIAPELDAENIAMLMHFLEELGITGASLRLNTRGVMADRGPAGEMLRAYFLPHLGTMCPDCQTRFQRNIWRILDCKQQACRDVVAGVPDYLAAYSADSRQYFERVLRALDALKVPYEEDRFLVRGLDYYVHTVFEVTHSALGGQSAVAGGGRYEVFLPEASRPAPGVGFAAGVERLLMVQDALGAGEIPAEGADIYLIGLGEAARMANLSLSAELRRQGLRVELEVEDKSFKAQMRGANRSCARKTLIRGEDELARKMVVLKEMSDGSQQEIPEEALLRVLKGEGVC